LISAYVQNQTIDRRLKIVDIKKIMRSQKSNVEISFIKANNSIFIAALDKSIIIGNVTGENCFKYKISRQFLPLICEKTDYADKKSNDEILKKKKSM